MHLIPWNKSSLDNLWSCTIVDRKKTSTRNVAEWMIREKAPTNTNKGYEQVKSITNILKFEKYGACNELNDGLGEQGSQNRVSKESLRCGQRSEDRDI